MEFALKKQKPTIDLTGRAVLSDSYLGVRRPFPAGAFLIPPFVLRINARLVVAFDEHASQFAHRQRNTVLRVNHPIKSGLHGV